MDTLFGRHYFCSWFDFTPKKNQAIKYLHYFLLVLTLILLFFAQKTGTSGGEIRHPEISGNGNELVPANINDEKNQEKEHEHD